MAVDFGGERGSALVAGEEVEGDDLVVGGVVLGGNLKYLLLCFVKFILHKSYRVIVFSHLELYERLIIGDILFFYNLIDLYLGS